ncbi:MAG: DHHA1 domain-containing protein [Candidatus Micrarchaeia archaeon]|jgi:nanoRNase/pAp phosphatase (c-di-AMP/oligoRNAs hydrolase)
MADLSFLDLLRGRRTAFTFHSLGDVDGVAAAFALKRHFGNALVLPVDRVNSLSKKLLDYVGFSLDGDAPFDEIVALDCNSEALLGRFAGKRFFAVIDHHSRHADPPLARHRAIDESYSSASEMVYEYLRSKGESLDHRVAFLLACGIITDSAGFRHSRRQTFIYMGELLEHAQMDYAEIAEMLEPEPTKEARLIVLKACKDAEVFEAGKFVIAVAKAKNLEAAAADALVEAGADVAFVGFAGKDARISARASRRASAQLQLTGIMAQAGKVLGGSGGGHPGAAGADGPKLAKLDAALAECRKLAVQRLGR